MGLSSYTPTSVIAHKTSVDFSKRNISQPVHIVQYDKRLPILAVNIYNNGQLYPIPSDATVSIRFGKPDKTFVYNEAIGCDSTRTIVYFEITEQMTIYDGEFYPVIEILRDNKTANSSKIYIIVDRNPIQIGDIESTVEFKNLTEYRDEAKAAAEEAKKAATGVSEIKNKAEEAANNASKSEANSKASADNSAKSASDAKNFADNASSSATKAAQSEANAKESEANASTKATEASSSATKAAQSEANAKKSEVNASTKATEASSSATKAAQSEANAKESEVNASTKATEASTSATKAAQSEANANESANEAARLEQSVIDHKNTVTQLANDAEVSAKKSESWAVGGTSTRDGEDTNNSKWYAEQAKKSAQKAEAIAGGNFIPTSDKGVAGGVAVLDDNLAVAKTVGDEDGNNIQETYAKKTEVPKLVEVDGETITKDENGVLHGVAEVTIDSVLSDTSTNTVQNKVIKSSLDGKLERNTSGGIASCYGEGKYDCFKIATIKITESYINRPIVFEMSGRGKGLSLVTIVFASSESTDPTLLHFKSNNDDCFWIKKTTTSTWEVYGQHADVWGMYVLHRITGAGANIGVTVNMTNIDSLPNECTQVVYGGNVNYATKAKQDEDGNNIKSTYAKKNEIPEVTIDSVLSDTSTNTVQNKVIKSALDGKADNNHTHNNYLTAHPTITTSSDTTSTVSPSAGGTLTVIDSVTRDSNGHVTKVNTKTVTLPKSETTVTGTLSAGQTSIRLSNSAITTDSTIEPYTSVYGVNPKTITVSAGSVTMTFKAQSKDIGVKVVVK